MKQNHLLKIGFVIFLKGAPFSDFFDYRLLNYMPSDIQICIPLFWGIFFNQFPASSSSATVYIPIFSRKNFLHSIPTYTFIKSFFHKVFFGKEIRKIGKMAQWEAHILCSSNVFEDIFVFEYIYVQASPNESSNMHNLFKICATFVFLCISQPLWAFFYLTQHNELEPRLKKNFSTEMEYGVWKLFSCSFTYQSPKNPFPQPL